MSSLAKYVAQTVRLLTQLGIAEEALAVALKFDPKPGTRADDVKWFRAKIQKALDDIRAIDRREVLKRKA